MQQPDHTSLNFILSTGRTGSTLLSSMLNMHPEILSVSEEPFSYNLFPKYKNITNWTNEIIEQFCYDFYLFSEGKLEPQFGKKEDIIKLLKQHQSILTGENAIKLAYFAFFPNKDKSQVNTIVDKQLKFHHFLNEVSVFYPKSKFIILYRDPRDNALVKLRRGQKQNKAEELFFYAKTWNYEYKTIRKCIARLPANNYYEVKYEELVSNTEATLKKICSFLNVPYQDIMLQYDQHIRKDMASQSDLLSTTVKKHLALLHEGLTQKPNTDKVGHWKQGFSQEQNNLVWSICAETALKVGYEADGCSQKSYFKINMIKSFFRFYLIKVIIPGIYYKLPYFIKYTVKKVKYSKNFKNGKWATKDFYSTTLPN